MRNRSAGVRPEVLINDAVRDGVTRSVTVWYEALALEPKIMSARLVMVLQSAWCVHRRRKRLTTYDCTFSRTPQVRLGTRLALQD